MDAAALRNRIRHEEFDYQTLLDALSDYDRPRDKITRLLRQGVIIRVKKGLYVFGEDYRRKSVSREVLASLIYGPSYISLEFALQFHGLIPEQVREVTSITTGRSRRFDTPVGVFSYRQVSMPVFRQGMDRVALPDKRAFLIATPEKALADKLLAERGRGLSSRRDLQSYLVENLRISSELLVSLDADSIESVADAAGSRRLQLLATVIRHMRADEKGEH